MRRALLGIAVLVCVLWMSGLAGCNSGSSGTSDGDDTDCPEGQAYGPDGKCHDVIKPTDGDEPDGDQTDGDRPDGDGPDGDPPDGDNSDGDQTDGDQTDGDKTDGDQTDGDQTDGDQTDGDQTDGDQTDGDQTDGDDPDGDLETGPCEGPCVDDNACNTGCYCGNLGQCTKDCEAGLEFVCGSLCCNYVRGRCEACPDGDEDEDADDPISCTTSDECPLYYYCGALGWCQSNCHPVNNPCQPDTEYYCSDRGQCLPIDPGEKSAQPAPNVLRTCATRADCAKGDICDWVNKVCIPGCSLNTDCPPESPTCAGGVCF